MGPLRLSGLYCQLSKLLNSGNLGLGRSFLTVQAYALRRTSIPISQGKVAQEKELGHYLCRVKDVLAKLHHHHPFFFVIIDNLEEGYEIFANTYPPRALSYLVG